jgi:pimeloyl-ACP methyl ester carboxylesterase
MMITSNTRTIRGYRVHYLEAGSGSPVLLLHGFAGSCEEWRSTVEFLAHNGYRAIAVDAVGFGKSDKPGDAPYSFTFFADIYMGLLDELGLEQITLVGHSFGGKCALATTIMHPQRIHRLVVVDSEGFIPLPFWMKKSGLVPFLGKVFLWMSRNPRIFRMQLQGTFYDPSRITSEMEEQFRAILYDPASSQALVQLSRCYDDHDLERTGIRARLGEMSCPTLILWGENDRVFAPSCAEAANREIPGSELVLIPECGHYPHLECPRPFRGALLGFLAKGAQA